MDTSGCSFSGTFELALLGDDWMAHEAFKAHDRFSFASNVCSVRVALGMSSRLSAFNISSIDVGNNLAPQRNKLHTDSSDYDSI